MNIGSFFELPPKAKILGNMEVVGKSISFHEWLTENIAQANNSNNIHDFRKIMEIIANTKISNDELTENIGKINNFHDFPKNPMSQSHSSENHRN